MPEEKSSPNHVPNTMDRAPNTLTGQHPPDSLLRLVARTCGYAATALCAHLAGYFLLAQPRELLELLLPIALWCSSLPFYLSYAVSYPFSKKHQASQDAAAIEATRTATHQALPIIALLATAALVAFYAALARQWPPPLFWPALCFFTIIPFSYGRYLIRRQQEGTAPIMRHQIVWPVLLTIALPLYAGVMFAPSPSPVLAGLPALLLLGYFFLSIKFTRVTFVAVSLSLLGLLTVIVILDLKVHVSHLDSFLLSIAVSAYLAVFEAWRITAHMARNVTDEQPAGNFTPTLPKYYLPTAVALSIAALSLPLVYTFSSLGWLFFVGVVLHTAAAASVWYWAGGLSSRISEHRWVVPKTLFGYLFLLILVSDAYFPAQPSVRILPSFVNVSFLAIFIGFALVVFFARFGGQLFTDPDTFWDRVAGTRLAPSILTLLLATVFAFVTLGVPDVTPALSARSDGVFYYYIMAILMSTLALFQGTTFTKLRGLFAKALGVLSLTRFFTSGMIGLAIFLPSIHSGIAPRVALGWALPFFLAASAGFAFNDFFDYERDRIDKPYRALPRGLLERRTALILGIGLSLAGLVVAVLFRTSSGALALQICALLGSTCYVLIVRWIGVLKWLYTALLCSLPACFVLFLLSYSRTKWLVAATLLLFVSGREIMMDLLDERGDRRSSIKTLPVLWGRVKTKRLALGLYAVSGIPLLFLGGFAGSQIRTILISTTLALIGSMIVACMVPSALAHQRSIVRSGWIPMILAFILLMV